MEEVYDDLSVEELKKELDLVNDEISDLEMELELTFGAGNIHIGPAEMETELDSVNRERARLSMRKERIEEAILRKRPN